MLDGSRPAQNKKMATNNLSEDLVPITSTTMADIVEVRFREYLKKKSFRLICQWYTYQECGPFAQCTARGA